MTHMQDAGIYMKRGLVSVCMMVMMTIMVGCGRKEQTKPLSMAIAGCGHQCMPVYSEECSAIHDNLYKVAYSQGDITMINCDGSPQVYFQTTIPENAVKGLSAKKRNSIAENYTKQLMGAYTQGTAVVPEADTLKAISLGARALAPKQNKMLLIVDSGLQTTGYVNFTNGLLEVSPEAIAEALEKIGSLPDLDGVECVWLGCGDTISPQKELTERQKDNLKQIWSTILYAAGAKSVTFHQDFSTGTAYKDVPKVTTINIEEETLEIDLPDSKKTLSKTNKEPIETIVLDSTQLQFVANQTCFAEETVAREVLQKVAMELVAHPDNCVYVIGTTAGGRSTPFCYALSEGRATIVCKELETLGVAINQMIPIGLASNDPWYEYDLDENGNMIEEIAFKNRKTVIMDVNSKEAALIAM